MINTSIESRFAISHSVARRFIADLLAPLGAHAAGHKAIHFRRPAAKPEAHRYERRKMRELLRHNVDAEEAPLRFEQFG